jgi:hypothetical protein
LKQHDSHERGRALLNAPRLDGVDQGFVKLSTIDPSLARPE